MDYVSVVYFKIIMNFEKKFFSFNLSSVVINSKFITSSKSGWIIKLQNKDNHVGFGEISPIFKNDLKICNRQINQIPKLNKEINIIEKISKFHPSIQSGINSAIAEIKGEIKSVSANVFCCLSDGFDTDKIDKCL